MLRSGLSDLSLLHFRNDAQSWPMHHEAASTNYAWLPHNKHPDSFPVPDRLKDMPVTPLEGAQSRYEEYMQNCFEYYEKQRGKGERCYDTEEDRLEMTYRQPKGMRNYTEVGFKKIRAPDHVYKLIRDFWDKNKDHRQKEVRTRR